MSGCGEVVLVAEQGQSSAVQGGNVMEGDREGHPSCNAS